MRMTSAKQKFLDSDVAVAARTELQRMTGDPGYNTQPMFSATMVEALSFEEKHMNYMSERPKLDPPMYLANLRLMTRVKS